MEISHSSHYLGAIAALLSALSWAISAHLFARIAHQINAITINLFKGLIAVLCLLLFVLPINWSEINASQWIFLGLSGLLGISLGDTLYFLTLKRLGARLTLLMSTLIPLVTATAAVFIFSERLSLLAIIALCITFCAVFYVLWSKAEREHTKANYAGGLWLGIIFVATEASAILLTKAAVLELDSMLVTFIRQVIGVAGITIWLLSVNQFNQSIGTLITHKSQISRLISAAVIGGFIGTWLSIYALKATHASVAVILNSTSPLFIIPLSIWLLKEKVPKSSIYGATIAVFGIMLYFLQITI